MHIVSILYDNIVVHLTILWLSSAKEDRSGWPCRQARRIGYNQINDQ